jgi:hypothetical protein
LEKVIGNQKKAAAESEVDKEEKSNDIENKKRRLMLKEIHLSRRGPSIMEKML